MNDNNTSNKQLRLFMVQQNPIVGDIRVNLDLAKKSIEQAVSHNADIVLFSELFITGYPTEDLVLKKSFLYASDKAISELCEFSKDIPLAIVIGAPCSEVNKIYNSLYFISNGKIISKAYKRDLPNYAEFDEKRIFTEGSTSCIVKYKDFNVGLLICEDIWNDADIVASLAKKNIDIILVSNASPYRTNKREKRMELVKHLTMSSNLPIVYVNQVGGQDEMVFDGASFAYDREGQKVIELSQFETDTGLIELSDKLRNVTPSFITPAKYNDLAADYYACVLGTRDYLIKNSFKKAIIGLSGGLDSALCATIVSDAIGAENLYCFMLSYDYTSLSSFTDARLCAELLGCHYEEISISEMMDAFCGSLQPVFTKLDNILSINNSSSLWHENLQSRIRGSILMALSNKYNAMLITTGNKSELATGYATIYGDMNGGFNPIKDLYKSRVYKLANWRNNNMFDGFLGKPGLVIPENILTKPASAELREGQVDQDTLPDYEILDKILYNLVEEDRSIAEIVSLGFDVELVKKVERMLYLSEYKRFQAAPGVRLGKKNFGSDRRYPITNKFRDSE